MSCLDFDRRLRFEIDFCLSFDCTCGNFSDMSIMVILTTMHLKIDRDHVDDDDVMTTILAIMTNTGIVITMTMLYDCGDDDSD